MPKTCFFYFFWQISGQYWQELVFENILSSNITKLFKFWTDIVIIVLDV